MAEYVQGTVEMDSFFYLAYPLGIFKILAFFCLNETEEVLS
jgi:hypothetical protein